MKYTIMLSGADENHLFYRLDGETAERNGAIGYLRIDLGKSGKEFYSTWFDNQKNLNSTSFKTEFDSVINYLRYEMEYPILGNRRELNILYKFRSDLLVADRVMGFKIQTKDHTYYIRCKPSTNDYDAHIYAYDNRYLLPELMGLHSIPEGCFSVLPSSGQLIFIAANESGYYPSGRSTDRDKNRRIADEANKDICVTRSQEEAMLAGSLFGCNKPALNRGTTNRTVHQE